MIIIQSSQNFPRGITLNNQCTMLKLYYICGLKLHGVEGVWNDREIEWKMQLFVHSYFRG
mgnify:FL=1